MIDIYEQLEEEAESEGVTICPYEFESKRLGGIYMDGVIGLGTHLKTYAEKSCVLAEELGHYYTTTGNILDQSSVSNRKQERHARKWAHDRLIGLSGIVEAYLHGCRNAYEIADFLDVTESFLLESLEEYRSRYGSYVREGDYYIYFEPCLGVMRVF